LAKKIQLLSRADFAKAQGVSRQMVDRYVKSGMPLQDGKVDPKQAEAWIAQNILSRSKPGESFAEAKTRTQIAEAGIRELQLEILQGRYIDADEMREVLGRVYLGAREVWLQAIAKISMRLGLDVDQEQVVKEIIYAGLTSLASGRILEEKKPLCEAKRKRLSRKK
jgi:hypothetical protein